jgi:hypothetical protein
MNDPLVQTCIVGAATNLAGAAIAFYLWTERRSERYLLFWGWAWTTGLMRWLIHYPAEFSPPLRALEGVNIAVTMFFIVLGSYDLLPAKPWRQRSVVAATGLVLVVYTIAANRLRLPLEMGYALFAAVLAFCAICMGIGYRAERLNGYAFAAGTFAYQFGVVALLLLGLGRDVANSVVAPLYNIPLALSIVVIAYQRQRRRRS